jgi:aerobic carbon-monoxide dehydrogenase medium subunit
MKSFEFHRPQSVADAVTLLRANEGAKLLAGGQSLLPVMKLDLAQPSDLVSLAGLAGADGLKEIRSEGGELVIGALVTHYEVSSSPEVRQRIPGLAGLAGGIGDAQIRNRGTLGGSLAHADPASDLPAGVLALGGAIVVRGPRGERQVPVEEFFTGLFSTALEPDELVVEVRVPRTGSAGWAYEKFTRRANDWAIVAVAVVDGRVGLVNMGSTALRASATEAALTSGASIPDAAALADQDTDPPNDLAGTPAYRRHLVRVLTRRALTTAAEPR